MKKIVKSYYEDGLKYQFDSKKMLMYANQMKHDLILMGEKKNKSFIMKELSEILFVSEDAVKSWMYGNNGPSELEQVKVVADYFKVDYHQLLNKEEEEMATNNGIVGMMNDVQAKYTKERVREIYTALRACVNAMLTYYYSEYEYVVEEKRSPECKDNTGASYGAAEDAFQRVDDLLEAYLLDIPEKFYNSVSEYLWSELHSRLDEIVGTFNDNSESGEKDVTADDEDLQILRAEIYQYRRSGYNDDMRRIFADYIVKQ